MQNRTSEPQPALMNDVDLAQHLGISVAALRKWRTLGRGPRYLKIGNLVRYRREDIDAFLNACPVGGSRVQQQ